MIEVAGLTKRYGDVVAADNVSLRVATGSSLAVLGPSGSGKSTVLSCIAGLVEQATGTIHVDGHDLHGVATHRRPVTLLMQQPRLFGHLSVRDNVAFGLRVRGVARRERHRVADEMLDVVGLAGLGDRGPTELSGGQQQRVAIARALVTEPTVLLADEPFSSLDPSIRAELQSLLRTLQRERKMTMIVVTHDLDEAFALGDEVAVMVNGTIEAKGAPAELLSAPRTLTVARLLGMRNVFGTDRAFERLTGRPGVRHEPPDGDVVVAHPRRTHLTIDGDGLSGTVTGHRPVGPDIEATVRLNDDTTVWAICGADAPAVGAQVYITVAANDLALVTESS